jgi:hypothetical protein
MKRSTKYVGLDVYEATTVACVREESGRVIARAVVPTEEEALLELVGTMRGSVHVAFEEGTQAQWLDDLLTPRLHRVLLCDRRGEKKQGNKGDLLDADQISAAASAAASRPGPLHEFYLGMVERGMKEELARVTLASKLAALTFHIWKTGETYDPSKLSTQGA